MIYQLKDRYLSIAVDSLFCDTIQDFFDSYIPSKKIQHLLIQNKWIMLDGNPVKRESDISGLMLEILLYPEEYSYADSKFRPDVVYEDELILIVNKPKGVLVHDDGSGEDNLTKWVEGYYRDKNYINVTALHRLDRETSGLVMFSKSVIFQPLLDKLLAEKQIRRYYLAFVQGKMAEGQSITINKPLGKDRHDSRKRVVFDGGQSALTKVRSLACKEGISILRCILDSGRTHQIRVHLASEGYKILNDELYGVRSSRIVRMGLIADELEFYHPLKEEKILVDCPLPNDLSRLYQELCA